MSGHRAILSVAVDPRRRALLGIQTRLHGATVVAIVVVRRHGDPLRKSLVLIEGLHLPEEYNFGLWIMNPRPLHFFRHPALPVAVLLRGVRAVCGGDGVGAPR